MKVAMCGLGVNSISMILEMTSRGVIFDEILFANTGIGRQRGEKIETYNYTEIFNAWLIANGQPKITILHSRNERGQLISLYDECLKLQTLPSIVFGYKTCSQRFKIAPQDKYLNNNGLARINWEMGAVVTKYIGYDADEAHRIKDYNSDKYSVEYPVVDWDWGRFECIERILREKLPLPPKSSCKFCPSTKPYQVIELYEKSRSEFYEAIYLERNALQGGRMTDIKGLGRDWSWWDLIVAYRYFAMFKRHSTLTSEINPKIRKMIKRARRSKPVPLTKRGLDNVVSKKSNKTAEAITCDLFTVNADLPCGCLD